MGLLAQSADAGLAAGTTTEVVLFVVFGGLAIGAGIAMVSMRNMVHAALMLVVNLLAIAGLYLVLETGFLSVVQIIVYAGAVMVLFLFVIMLLGLDRDDLLVDVHPVHRVGAVVAAVAVLGILGYGIVGPYTSAASVCPGQDGSTAQPAAGAVACRGFADTLAADALEGGAGSVDLIAGPLFTRWTFPFEAAALLLTVATIGAMLLGRRTDPDPDEDPAWVPSMVVSDDVVDLDDEDGHDPGPGEQRPGAGDEPVPASVGPVARGDTAGDDDASGATAAGEDA